MEVEEEERENEREIKSVKEKEEESKRHRMRVSGIELWREKDWKKERKMERARGSRK